MKVRAVQDPDRYRHKMIWGIAILVVAAALLAGCGKKGDPEPPGPESTYPQTYPSE